MDKGGANDAAPQNSAELTAFVQTLLNQMVRAIFHSIFTDRPLGRCWRRDSQYSSKKIPFLIN